MAKKPAKTGGPIDTRHYDVIVGPHITEKSTLLSEQNAVVFKVAPKATKPEIKAAVELMFKVNVESIQVANVGGKKKRFGQYMGRRRNWKKAYVCLAEGQEINFAQEG